MTSTQIRVAIVEDDQVTRDHLVALVRGTPGLECVGHHATAEMAMKHLLIVKPDVLLLDLELPKMQGVDLISQLKTRLTKIDVVVLTVHDEPKILFEALQAGAVGYLVKPASPVKIVEAIQEVFAGGAPMSSQIARLVVRSFQKRGQGRKQLETLTKREIEVLDRLAEGLSRKEIADKLGISHRTVGSHLKHIYEKLEAHSAIMALAKRSG